MHARTHVARARTTTDDERRDARSAGVAVWITARGGNTERTLTAAAGPSPCDPLSPRPCKAAAPKGPVFCFLNYLCHVDWRPLAWLTGRLHNGGIRSVRSPLRRAPLLAMHTCDPYRHALSRQSKDPGPAFCLIISLLYRGGRFFVVDVVGRWFRLRIVKRLQAD